MSRVDRAVVLAAGVGSRLKWLTHHRPKALMDVAGVPAIVRVIRRLAGQGVRDIAINLHHHADMIVEALGDGSRFGVRLVYSREAQLLDSGGGVRRAMELLPRGASLAVYNTDVMADIDLNELANHLPGAGAAIALVSNPPHHPRGDFSLRHGLVTSAGPHTYTFAGVSVWHDAVLRPYPADEAFPLAEPMRALIEEERLSGMVHHGHYWFDIGRPHDLMRARRALF
ncbi:MAG TPA: nucleotidyltransferase family protein [Mariprofundaceae bacterium]|nr:nucleotidyltransferase family protein [Mariprofundaceae bacterium]